jgi:hypothetical protein
MRRTWQTMWRGLWACGLLAVVMAGSVCAGGDETFDCAECHPLAGLRPFANRSRLIDWEQWSNWHPIAAWHARPEWDQRVTWPRLADWMPARRGWFDGSVRESLACWCEEKRDDINEKHPAFCGSGCGPRYWGAYHSEPLRCDPCDSCNRWTGYCGGHEMQEMLLPWQMAPCRGFRPPADAGYRPVNVCRGCKTPTSVWW